MKPETDVRTVTAGVIRRGDEYLIAKRRPGGDLSGKWEFPGGKVKEGEDDKAALARELREELAIEAAVGDFLAAAPFEHGGRRYELKAYAVDWVGGEIILREHEEVRWVPSSELRAFDFAGSDRAIVAVILGGKR